MHCPTYLHVWMQLKNPPSLILQLLLSSLLDLWTMEKTKVGPLIQLQYCLQCWLSLHTCNKLAMLPLLMLIWRKFLECGSRFEPWLLDFPLWWYPTGGPVPWFSWAVLKGTTACYSRPTVCYLLGKAPPGVWACLSVSRAGSCRDCSGCLGRIRLFWPFETLSLDLLGLLRPIGRTLGLGQGYCALGSVFRLCCWALLVYPLHFVCNSTSGHCCPWKHFVQGWTTIGDLP